ncbi:VOC family protein [Halomarina pelagica]|uniref:VOC family protein n=1 Tax=Halomarina pelagica TaxID=2961599 RepID=UPI0020C2484A|nr:VOC family protein [Halomarina sp. BND7]
MITAVSHATVLVEDQDEALAYYTDVLGFEKRDDERTDEGRWLTVAPPDSEATQLALMAADADEHRERVGNQVSDYVAFVLATDDCRAEYDRLREAGVEFLGEPEEWPWGVEVQFEDLYGNRLDLFEPRPMDDADEA